MAKKKEAEDYLDYPDRMTIQLDIPYDKLKRVLELVSQSGEVSVEASDTVDCDGENMLLVFVK